MYGIDGFHIAAHMIFSCELTFLDLVLYVVESHVVKEYVLAVGHPDEVIVRPI